MFDFLNNYLALIWKEIICCINWKQAHKKLYDVCGENYMMSVVKKLWNYDSHKISLLNFSADDIKSPLDLFFIERNETVFPTRYYETDRG